MGSRLSTFSSFKARLRIEFVALSQDHGFRGYEIVISLASNSAPWIDLFFGVAASVRDPGVSPTGSVIRLGTGRKCVTHWLLSGTVWDSLVR